MKDPNPRFSPGLTTETTAALSGLKTIIEPCHEIMVLFVLRKVILKTRMRSHPKGLDV